MQFHAGVQRVAIGRHRRLQIAAELGPRRDADVRFECEVEFVGRGNDVAEFDAVGMADIEAGRQMQKDTIFQIMSMTKPVTAIGRAL